MFFVQTKEKFGSKKIGKSLIQAAEQFIRSNSFNLFLLV